MVTAEKSKNSITNKRKFAFIKIKNKSENKKNSIEYLCFNILIIKLNYVLSLETDCITKL